MLPKLSPRTRRAAVNIGRALRTAREHAHVSQETLAAEIGMTRTNYARVEHGKTNVTIDTLTRIADGLGVELTIRLAKPRRR